MSLLAQLVGDSRSGLEQEEIIQKIALQLCPRRIIRLI